MKPIRVLQIITRLIVGGAQETVMYAADFLDKKRFQMEVLSGPQTGSEGSLIEEVRARDIPLTIFPELLREVSPLHDLNALWKMVRFIRNNHFDIVHTNSSKAGILGRAAAHLAGTPVIVHTVHGWSFHDYMSPAVRQTYIRLEQFTARLTDALIVVAEPDIEKGLKAGIGKREQYVLIRSAVPLSEFEPARFDSGAVRQELGIPPGSAVLGNVGRFSSQKNPVDWVRVAGRVARRLPDCRFLLVGDGPRRPEVEAALRDDGILDRTTLTGLRRDVPRLLAAMDVFLLTSLWEGLPRVIPQAMHMSIPVVAYRADGTAEAITHAETGYLSEPGNLDQAAEYCVTLLTDPPLRQRMGAQGRAYAAREFRVESMITKLEWLYEELLNQKIPSKEPLHENP